MHGDLSATSFYRDPSLAFSRIVSLRWTCPCEQAAHLSHTHTQSEESSGKFPNPLNKLEILLLDNSLPVSETSLFWNHCLEKKFFLLSPLAKVKSIQLEWKELVRSREMEREKPLPSGGGGGSRKTGSSGHLGQFLKLVWLWCPQLAGLRGVCQ